MRYFFVALLALCFIHCKNQQPTTPSGLPAGEDLTLEWELISNQMDEHTPAEVHFRIINNSEKILPDTGWAIYFSQIIGPIPNPGELKTLAVENLDGEFYRLFPLEDFEPMQPGESRDFSFTGRGFSTKISEAPSGVYIVYRNTKGEELEPQLITMKVLPYTNPQQILKNANDKLPLQTPQYRYAENANLPQLPANQVQPIVPTPVTFTPGQGTFTLDKNTTIYYSNGLENAANALRAALKDVLGTELSLSKSAPTGGNAISLRLEPTAGESSEAYNLTIAGDGIIISGADAAGVFYGVQSLRQLLPIEAYAQQQSSIPLAAVTVTDAPRFAYRGIHLDVSRNFHKKEAVLKLLDLMAFYKINKFHFHLTDDEGWRIEIPGLPELTEVGARRGHTLTEEEFLQPAYGSGPFPDANRSAGSGYYTRADYIEILQYAKARHIEVIPEIDIPGHARAAIISMKNRYRRFMAKGDQTAAEEFLLHDPNDKSNYRSVQNYPDNVLNVCRESTYRFLEKVFDEIIYMHRDAGMPLQIMHIGSDEVPEGVWEGSPMCQSQINEDDGLNTKDELTSYFLTRLDAILDKKGVRLAGWEEIALQRDLQNGQVNYLVNPAFADDNFLPYVWNSQGWAADLSYRLANAGYDVVLCNVTNFYFDLAYDNDPEESGLYWGGYVDTKMAYRFTPYDVFAATRVSNMGQPTDVDNLRRTRENLKPEARQHLLGLQAQLWSETVRGQDMMEYYFFPKLFGLAERAWAEERAWESIPDTKEQDKALDADWATFANTLGQKQLPLLDYLYGGTKYRIPPPGATVEKGMLQANVAFPGLTIRYTTDGSEPTATSPEYTGPVAVDGIVKLKTFARNGRSSRTSEVGSAD